MSLEAGKELVRRYFEELANEGRLDTADDILVSEAVPIMQQFTTMLRTAFPDFHVTLHEIIAEGDFVAARFTARGTHLGMWQSPLGPVAPTGKPFEHEGVRLFRIANGRLADTWGGADTLRQMLQLGILPENLATHQ